jgi:hypothetical protein
LYCAARPLCFKPLNLLYALKGQIRAFLLLSILVVLSLIAINPAKSSTDPCDSYGDCVSSSINYLRSNPDSSLCLGDSFSVSLSITTGPNTTGYSVSWSYAPVFERAGDTFTVIENETGTFTVVESITFTGSSFSSILTASQTVTIIQLEITLRTQLINVTDSHGGVERNADGTFYNNDSFCDSWNATFLFAAQRTDIRINVSSLAPPLHIYNSSAGPLGREGRFCYVIETDSGFGPYYVTLVARALNWQGVSMALNESSQPLAIVRYDPQFTTYAYMEYRNSTAPSSLERPWVLFVGYDGNEPGYSYAGDSNTRPFNGSRTLSERSYFDNFTFSSLSYEPFDSRGVFMFHVTNSTGQPRYYWINRNASTVLEGGRQIEKYVFEANDSSLAPLLSQGFVYQNVTMRGCWTHEGGCYLRENYWLVPFLWSGRLNIVSVDANGSVLPSTTLSITIHNPSPLDDWLTSKFVHVFGNDPTALKAFQEDLYPTNQTMTFSGQGTMSFLLNQTSLVPPQISITSGGVTQTGNFTFVPTFVNSTITSISNSLNGTIHYANATIPLWSYNMIEGSLSFLPVSTTISDPMSFMELVNSSGWIAGNTTVPQTPSAFASQGYAFWPMGQNLTVYANLQGGGVDLLGVQKVSPGEYQALLDVAPWSGGISRIQLVEGESVIENKSTLNTATYPSPLPQGLVGFYTLSYPATGQDVKAIFTNVWGAKTMIDLGTAAAPAPLANLIPETTAAAFGIAGIIWLIASGILRMKRPVTYE